MNKSKNKKFNILKILIRKFKENFYLTFEMEFEDDFNFIVMHESKFF